jgi:hypothetical protein
MLNLLLNIDKPIMVNGKVYVNARAAYVALRFENYEGDVEVTFNFKEATEANVESLPRIEDDVQASIYLIEVRQYMTKKSTPEFTFMKEKNNDVPMPMRMMKGEIIEEKGKLVKMKLQGHYQGKTSECMVCLRKLTHPVSVMYGIGPECGEHHHMAPPASIEAFMAIEDEFREKIEAIEWTGWIPMSAITRREELHAKEIIRLRA